MTRSRRCGWWQLSALAVLGCGWRCCSAGAAGRRCSAWAGPTGITPEAHLNRELWIGSVIAALVVGVIVWGLIFWAAAFHRKKKDDTELPRQFGYNMPLELVLTVVAVPDHLGAVLLHRGGAGEDAAQGAQPRGRHRRHRLPVELEVRLPEGRLHRRHVQLRRRRPRAQGGDGVQAGGRRTRTARSSSAPIRGLNPEDRTYLNFDKVETLGTSTEIPVLVLPAGKRIEFQIASADVIHGFWVPEFLFKRDVMPNPEANNSDNIFQISEIDQTGAFVGRCTEMCGTYHSMMNFEVRVVEPNDFKAYLQQRIAGKTNAEALQAINQPPLAVTTHPFDTRRGELAAIPQASK